MSRYVTRARTGCLLSVILLVLSACIGHNAPRVNYFSLLSLEQLGDPQVIAAHPEIKLGIAAVTIPDSLKRSQIATRRRGNQFEFDEFNRWAGVLEKDLAAVVGDNLGILLGVEHIGYTPWRHHFLPTYRIMIDIQRLDGALDGEAVLWARWAVADADGKDLLAGGRSIFRQPVEEPGYAALVKAESQLIAELCKEVAGELKRMIGRQAPSP